LKVMQLLMITKSGDESKDEIKWVNMDVYRTITIILCQTNDLLNNNRHSMLIYHKRSVNARYAFPNELCSKYWLIYKMAYTTNSHWFHKCSRNYKCKPYRKYNGPNTDSWVIQGMDQVSRRSKRPYKHGPLNLPENGQVSRRSKHPYKHGPLGIPEDGSGV
jgi:hypothetical protein